jgi:hypothetical protein
MMSNQHGTVQFTPAHGTPMAVSAVSADLKWSNTVRVLGHYTNLTCSNWYQLTYKMSCLDACWSSPVSFSLSSLYQSTFLY